VRLGEETAMGTPAGEGERLPGPAASREASAASPETSATSREASAASPEAPAARPQTGDHRVDEALARLDELAGLPVTDHPAMFEHVHQRLAEVLGDLGTGDLGTGDAGSPGR
jgi:hypothetical protein